MKNSHSRLSLAVFYSSESSQKSENVLKLRGWFLKCYIFPYILLYVKEGDKREVFYVEI